MSDFDEEAEREKLREKYERDQRKRQTTEKMSELLLQGATMTNAHCSDCGDPIFRYDGQEFCPTCEKPVERKSDREGEDADTADDTDADGDEAGRGDAAEIEVTEPSDDARVAFGADGTSDGRPADEETEPAGETNAGRAAETPDSTPTTETLPESTQGGTDPARAGTAGGADVSAARDSLVRTLVRFSEAAERTEDPRRAREHLAAAREAAETLAALR